MQLSFSAIKTYQTCQRKYHFEYKQRLLPNARRHALEWGAAWHLAMEVWHHTHDLEKAIGTFNMSYQDDAQDTLRTQQSAKRLLTWYSQWYAMEVFDVVSSEQFLTLDMGSVSYAGKIDKVVQWDGALMAVEHKTTTGYLGSTFIRQFKPNLQLAGYVALLQRLVNPKITKVLIDAVYLGRNAPRNGEPKLRYEETVAPWEIEEWERTVATVGREITAKGDEWLAYTPNWSACTQYGECPYRRLCMSAPSIRERVATVDYHHEAPSEVPDGSD